ncbi:MAG: metalloregulator ArsR/SmtB family transcription factor [Rhizobiaceae bacterium]|nr:metalloregulator ArsR/SmtB family transcription factor [Rhizobiaceae bacterium]
MSRNQKSSNKLNFKPALKDVDEETTVLAERLKALAHPVRLQIIQNLALKESRCCNDFCACISLAQSTISQHLKILTSAGFINCETIGNCSLYSLNPDTLSQVTKHLDLICQLADKSLRLPHKKLKAL